MIPFRDMFLGRIPSAGQLAAMKKNGPSSRSANVRLPAFIMPANGIENNPPVRMPSGTIYWLHKGGIRRLSFKPAGKRSRSKRQQVRMAARVALRERFSPQA